MQQPEVILAGGTRIRTHGSMPREGGGFMITERHLEVRKSDTVGVISGFVGGHGGDVYWVAHIGDPCTAA